MIIGDFYKAIMARLLTITDIKHIDMYSDQLDGDEALGESFNYPAVFLTFRPLETVTLGQNRQQVDMDIEVMIAAHVIQSISNREKDVIRNKGLNHLDLVNSVHAKLQGFNGYMVSPNLNFGSLNRTNLEPFSAYIKSNRGAISINGNIYRTRLILDSALPTYEKVTPNPALEITQNMLPDED